MCLCSFGNALYAAAAPSFAAAVSSIGSPMTRIQELAELGVTKKFTVITGADKTLGKVRGLVLPQVNPSGVDRVVSKHASMREVREIYETAGSNPLVLKVGARGLDGLGRLISERLSAVEGIAGASSLVVTKTGKEEYGAPADAEATTQCRCSLCNAPILGGPHERIDGGRFYFDAEECAKGCKQRKLRKEAN